MLKCDKKMKMTFRKGLVISFVCAVVGCPGLCSCGNPSAAAGKSTTEADTLKVEETGGYRLPDIPPVLTDGGSRLLYLAEHYWDYFDFESFSPQEKDSVTEQILVDYLSLLPMLPYGESSRVLGETVALADSKGGEVLKYFFGLLDRYLYDPLSPMGNDEYMLPVAREALRARNADVAVRERASFLARELAKNRPGEVAADLRYTLADGRTGRMHDIRSELLLVLFYNPDCEHCLAVIGGMKEAGAIYRLQAAGRLKILAFYPDADREAWKNHLADIPGSWINGYDAPMEVEGKGTYLLKAIPTLYLLDRDKRVILKDARLDKVLEYLENVE